MRSLTCRRGGTEGDEGGGVNCCARRGTHDKTASVNRMEAIVRRGGRGGGGLGACPAHLEAQFMFRAAEVDFIDPIAVGVLGGLHARIVELLVAVFDFYRRRKRFG